MRRLMGIALLLGLVADAPAKDVTLVVSDPDGAAGRVGAPLSVSFAIQEHFGADADRERLRLVELVGPEREPGDTVPVQFVARVGTMADGRPRVPTKWEWGTLWFLMPPGAKGDRRFRLSLADQPATQGLTVTKDANGRSYGVSEGKLPVLRYNHGSVPVPEGTHAHFAKGESYERGDYISPLHGPDGEVLTDDYPKDHPHHRGVWWSWPVTRWKDQVFDIWAVVGVHARPVSMGRAEAGPVLAVLRADSAWKWRNYDTIVDEQVVIRAFRQMGRSRVVDVEVYLAAPVDGVSIGGRPKAGYGGFALRAAPCKERKITPHTDPPGAKPRRAWLDYSGVFAGAKGTSGVTIFEHVTNPDYPNPLHQYPGCNCVMPAYPAAREVPLVPDKRGGKVVVRTPLVLKHRLWIHPGGADGKQLADVWSAYNRPPKIKVVR